MTRRVKSAALFPVVVFLALSSQAFAKGRCKKWVYFVPGSVTLDHEDREEDFASQQECETKRQEHIARFKQNSGADVEIAPCECVPRKHR